MSDIIFEPRWTLDENSTEDDSIGIAMFGEEWPNVLADLRRPAPKSTGSAVVTSIDREAGVITLGKRNEP